MLSKLTQEEMEEMLRNNMIGRLGCNDGERTYVVPISYVYENGALLCHSHDGMKIQMMRRNPFVCFEIDEVRDFNNWRSVIAWGVYQELTEERDIEYARQFFSDYMLQMKTQETAAPPHQQESRFHELKPEYVPALYYRIHLQKITGRYERTF
ncbi:MAG TPA: pyridoxamine 5'-phosphate oxidase family protein [Flavipsychrobacter sp.]|nr:pyridoxamine 5'-phosphate oxidase family protein [Flavipsychrobacter sp.]